MTSGWLEDAWGTVDERGRHMFVSRAAGMTLDEAGRAHGVTRERVRQVVTKIEAHFLFLGDVYMADWRLRLDALAHAPAIPRAAIAAALGVNDHVMVGVFARAAGFKPPRTWAGDLAGWWAADPGELEALLRRVVGEAPMRSEELVAIAAAAGLPEDIPVVSLLDHERSPLTRGTNGDWLRRRARGRDAAYLWLLSRGEPSRAGDMTAATGIANSHAVSESLRRDNRFVQIRPEGTWALAEWSHPQVTAYSNAVEALVAVVTEAGPISRDALFARVVERYPVSAWRLRQCLLSDRVGTTEDGQIDLVARGARPGQVAEPKRPDSMVVDPMGNVLGVRLTVDRDILRGSGIQVNSWLTWKLGLRQAPMSTTFAVADGMEPLTIRRGTSGAQISSLRRYALAQGMELGCAIVVLLRLDDATGQVLHACKPGACGPAATRPRSMGDVARPFPGRARPGCPPVRPTACEWNA